jgi:hypothetical protein
MPGVYRDRDGNYRYQTFNDYEDRRRRDYDDRTAGRNPFGPQRPPWQPPPPPGWVQPPPVVVVQSQPPQQWGVEELEEMIAGSNAARTDDFLASLSAARPPDSIDAILAVLIGQPVPNGESDAAWFDRVVESLPARVGENPTFDGLFESPDTTILTAQDLVASLG